MLGRSSLFIVSFIFVIAGLALTVAAQPVTAACSPLPSGKGQAKYSVNIPATASYRVWSRIYSPSANNNAFYLQVDQTYCSITVGDSSTIPAGSFTWVNYQNATPSNLITMNLSAGIHAVTIAGLDDGVGVDRMMFLTDLNCVPTENGKNCTETAATAAPISSGTTGSSSTPSTFVVGSTSSPSSVSGVVKLQIGALEGTSSTSYTVDGKPVVGNTLDTSTLADGKHTIVAVTQEIDGTTSTQTSVVSTLNSPTFWQLVSNFLSRYWWELTLAIIALSTVVLFLFRRRLMSVYRTLRARIHFTLRDRKRDEPTKVDVTVASSPYFNDTLNNKDGNK